MSTVAMVGMRAVAGRERFRSVTLCSTNVASLNKKSIVFLGTPSVAAETLSSLLEAADSESYFEVSAVVTQPPSQRGRGRKQLPSPVAQLAIDRNFLPSRIYCPEKAGEEPFLEELTKLKPDLCVTAAYGNILPSKFLAIPSLGTVNLHPSLLPLYRGAAPVQRAVQDGVKTTGVSIAYTVRALDAGPIIASEIVDVDSYIKAPHLLSTLFRRGTDLLLRNLPSILDGTARSVATEQDHTRASLASKITIEESWLNFKEPAEGLHNKVRAFSEWPGTRARFQLFKTKGELENLVLKIVTTKVRLGISNQNNNCKVQFSGDALVVDCGGHSALEILELQPPAKKIMHARDFWNGLRGQQLFITTDSLAHNDLVPNVQ